MAFWSLLLLTATLIRFDVVISANLLNETEELYEIDEEVDDRREDGDGDSSPTTEFRYEQQNGGWPNNNWGGYNQNNQGYAGGQSSSWHQQPAQQQWNQQNQYYNNQNYGGGYSQQQQQGGPNNYWGSPQQSQNQQYNSNSGYQQRQWQQNNDNYPSSAPSSSNQNQNPPPGRTNTFQSQQKSTLANGATSPTNTQSTAKPCGVRPAAKGVRARLVRRHLFDNHDETAGDNNLGGTGNGAVLNTSRIVGGTVASVKFWPWQVSLRYNEAHVCGGSIISKSFILTAAHCFGRRTSKNTEDWTVFAGKSKLRIGEPDEAGPVAVDSIVTHPDFKKQKKKPLDSDIAILRLRTPLKFSGSVFPICLPSQGAAVPFEQDSYVTGYGETKGTGGEGQLKQAMFPIILQDQCSATNEKISAMLTDNMFCAGKLEGGTDSCQGDSGGPLVTRGENKNKNVYFQHGVVSFGFGCAEKNSPGIYTRVANFRSWIVRTIAQMQAKAAN